MIVWGIRVMYTNIKFHSENFLPPVGVPLVIKCVNLYGVSEMIEVVREKWVVDAVNEDIEFTAKDGSKIVGKFPWGVL